jgi:hypothetical protein
MSTSGVHAAARAGSFSPPPHTDSSNPLSTGRSEARSHDRPDGLTDGRTPNPENSVDNSALRRWGSLNPNQSTYPEYRNAQQFPDLALRKRAKKYWL